MPERKERASLRAKEHGQTPLTMAPPKLDRIVKPVPRILGADGDRNLNTCKKAITTYKGGA